MLKKFVLKIKGGERYADMPDMPPKDGSMMQKENRKNQYEACNKTEAARVASDNSKGKQIYLVNMENSISTKMSHRYGPEFHPQILSGNGKSIAVKEKTPLAFCANCNADMPMKWKPPDKRGKTVESWFVCAACGYDKLEIKRMSHAEAVEINMKEKNERGKYEQRQS